MKITLNKTKTPNLNRISLKSKDEVLSDIRLNLGILGGALLKDQKTRVKFQILNGLAVIVLGREDIDKTAEFIYREYVSEEMKLSKKIGLH